MLLTPSSQSVSQWLQSLEGTHGIVLGLGVGLSIGLMGLGVITGLTGLGVTVGLMRLGVGEGGTEGDGPGGVGDGDGDGLTGPGGPATSLSAYAYPAPTVSLPHKKEQRRHSPAAKRGHRQVDNRLLPLRHPESVLLHQRH